MVAQIRHRNPDIPPGHFPLNILTLDSLPTGYSPKHFTRGHFDMPPGNSSPRHTSFQFNFIRSLVLTSIRERHSPHGSDVNKSTRPNLSDKDQDQDQDQTFCITTALKHYSLKPEQENKHKASCSIAMQILFNSKTQSTHNSSNYSVS